MTRRQAFATIVLSILFLGLGHATSFSAEPPARQRVVAKVEGLVCQF